MESDHDRGGQIMTSIDNDSLHGGGSTLYHQTVGFINTAYYLLLIPVAFLGNLLTIIVVSYIVRHQRTRRSIPDLCVGILACVDLFSVVFVHSLTLGAMGAGRWPYPKWVCEYQAFASTTYLKLEFLVQVTISADRYFAVVRPLKYHRLSSLRIMRIILLCILLVSAGTTVLAVVSSTGEVNLLGSWNICMYEWKLHSWGDYAVVSLNGFIFVFGLVGFILCNGSLVRILWQYHARKADSLLKEITNAVNAMKKEKELKSKAQSPSPVQDNGLSPLPSHQIKYPHQADQFSTLDENSKYGIDREPHLDNHRTEGVAGAASPTPDINTGALNLPGLSTQTDIDLYSDQRADKGRGSTGELQSNPAQLQMHDRHATSTSSPQNMPFADANKDNLLAQGMQPGSSVVLSTSGSTNPPKIDCSCGVDKTSAPVVVVKALPHATTPTTAHTAGPRPAPLPQIQEVDFPVPDNFGIDSEYVLDLEQSLSTGSSKNLVGPDTKTSILESEVLLKNKNLPPKRDSFNKSRRPAFKKSISFVDTPTRPKAIPLKKSPSLNLLKGSASKVQASHCHSPDTSSHRLASKCKSEGRIVSSKTKSLQSISLKQPHGLSNASQSHHPKSQHVMKNSCSSKNSSPSPCSESPPSQFVQFQQHLQKLLRKVHRKAKKQRREMLLARLVLLCASVFVATWIPYLVVLCLGLAEIHVSHIIENVALKMVFFNAMLNPIFYGLCRKNYRKGYRYTTQLMMHFLSCGCVDRPGDDKVFFESRGKKVRRHLQAAEMTRIRKRSAHALNILQQTLYLRPNSPLEKPPEFAPSDKLQALFERCMAQSDSESSDSSSVDYDALVFEDGELYKNLQKVWSMYLNASELQIYSNESGGNFTEEADDIELDIDYDALVGRSSVDNGGGFLDIYANHENRSDCGGDAGGRVGGAEPRLAMSTPNFRQWNRPNDDNLSETVTRM